MANPGDFQQNFDAACAQLDRDSLTDEKLVKFLAVNCVTHWNQIMPKITPENASEVKKQMREEYRYVRDRFVNELPVFPLSNNLLDETERDLQFSKDDFPKLPGP